MRRLRGLAIIAAVIVAALPARGEAPLPAVLQVLGTVTNAAAPVSNALVIALNLQDLAAVQAWTNPDGSFTLPTLRSGIYKVIAVKQGFVPAITTIVPTRARQKITLRLESEKHARKKDLNQEIWELRATLPPDVLRELDFAMQPAEIVTYEIPRFRGEMQSLTGVTTQPANPAYAQTTVGVQGRIGTNLQVGIRGNLQRFDNPGNEIRIDGPVAESSVMSMEVSPSPTQSYRVATTQSSWLYRDAPDGQQQADVRAHNFEWKNGPARVQVRYFAQENLFRNTPNGSNLIEVGGAMPLVQTRRNDVALNIRVTQEQIGSNREALRTADVSASGSIFLVPALVLHYGMASRIGMDGQEWAPRTGAELKLTDSSSVIGSVSYKVLDRDPSTLALPSLVFWSEDMRVLPRYAYTVGFVSGKENGNRFSAIATVSAVDDPLRVVFADEMNQFWDGLYVDSGDVRRDLRVAYRREFGNVLAIDLATSAGTAAPRSLAANAPDRDKVYITGDLQSTFMPTRTTLAVSYRELQQPGENGDSDYETERIHLRMAQSLYLPIDIRLLLGLELARAENSPYLIDTLTPEGRSKKYIGGLAVNF